jgi:hypothetical protein
MGSLGGGYAKLLMSHMGAIRQQPGQPH